MSDSINDSAAIAFSYAFIGALLDEVSRTHLTKGWLKFFLAGQTGEDKS